MQPMCGIVRNVFYLYGFHPNKLTTESENKNCMSLSLNRPCYVPQIFPGYVLFPLPSTIQTSAIVMVAIIVTTIHMYIVIIYSSCYPSPC